jgi:hypothetical protein
VRDGLIAAHVGRADDHSEPVSNLHMRLVFGQSGTLLKRPL